MVPVYSEQDVIEGVAKLLDALERDEKELVRKLSVLSLR